MQGSQPSLFRSLIWWTVYSVCGVWAMYLVPGVDFLLPGLLCSMQEGNKAQTIWLMLLFTLIQEGAGLLAFGPGLLWYAMACLLFYLGRSLFEAENIVFILILSAAMGAGHVVIGITMRHLQDVAILLPRLVSDGCLNAVIIPLVWFVVFRLRERELRNVNAA
ncbi:hypothetical protein [Desulfovibrio subterraneus]|jgi:hypothetical protein|uniref:Rod shape-determining protein MreD n=1 Tax=Desulfovibrio subterraneus TaxID=2718620 RepID=A0A7J0BFN2_9BACT|nr:hypothetical protein [Desulfovibrio subterraneus]GFM31985.1 hypothetical protein DSM101010T_03500 [Desulfovibrio subterraneus]